MNFTKRQVVFTIVASFIVITFIIIGANNYFKKERSEKDIIENSEISVAASPLPTANNKIKVHIKGEVKNPGLYELDSGKRVQDLVEFAGGATENADLDAVNLAEKLIDAQEVIIPKKVPENTVQSAQPQATSQSGQTQKTKSTLSPSSGKININTATKQQLMSLPGIGEVYAQRIIDYRGKYGGFKTIDEIKKVDGIGQKRFEAIKDLIIN